MDQQSSNLQQSSAGPQTLHSAHRPRKQKKFRRLRRLQKLLCCFTPQEDGNVSQEQSKTFHLADIHRPSEENTTEVCASSSKEELFLVKSELFTKELQSLPSSLKEEKEKEEVQEDEREFQRVKESNWLSSPLKREEHGEEKELQNEHDGVEVADDEEAQEVPINLIFDTKSVLSSSSEETQSWRSVSLSSEQIEEEEDETEELSINVYLMSQPSSLEEDEEQSEMGVEVEEDVSMNVFFLESQQFSSSSSDEQEAEKEAIKEIVVDVTINMLPLSQSSSEEENEEEQEGEGVEEEEVPMNMFITSEPMSSLSSVAEDQESVESEDKVEEDVLINAYLDTHGNNIPRMSLNQLENVTVNSLIGRGATSRVELMKISQNDCLVVLKHLNTSDAKSVLLKEMIPLHGLQHCLAFPQLLGVIDTDKSQPSLVMEFVGDWHTMTSTSVGDALNSFNPHLSTVEWLTVGRDVAQGLASLHWDGFVHGDLHTDNIMLCRYPLLRNPLARWQAKIIDLGCSESIASPPPLLQLTDKQKAKWRKCYPFKAPELIDGITPHTPATDIYAFGHVISEIGIIRDIEPLRNMGKMCMNTNPRLRGDLRIIARELACKVFQQQSSHGF